MEKDKLVSYWNESSEHDYKAMLDTISGFNINTRYNDYKQSFYKKCTIEFTEKWIQNIRALRVWIKKQLSKL